MPTATITFEVNPPVLATEKEIIEWVKFEIGETSQMDGHNPLCDYELTSVKITDFKITK